MKRLRIRWNASTFDEYLAHHGADIAEDHIFLPTNKPLDPGTSVRFELLLADERPFLSGTAMVAGNRTDPRGRPGMLLWFERLDREHAETIARLEHEASAGPDEDTKPGPDPRALWDHLVGSDDSGEG